MTAHLSEQDIRFYRRRSLPAQDLIRVSNHLAECRECRARIASAAEAQAAVQIIREGVESEGVSNNHLTYEDLETYVDSELAEPELLRVEDHIRRCKQCSISVRQTKALQQELQARATEVSTPKNRDRWQPRVVVDWLRHVSARAWVSAVTACAVIAMVVSVSLRNSPEGVEKLLAQAYTENRNLEMRIPYAAHAGFHQLKSGDGESLLNAPESLGKAASEIRSQLKKNPDDPHWLILSARLDLLDWRYKSAFATLDKIKANVDTPELLLTRALAEFEKAEMEHDQQGYAEAVDLMGKTLQSSPDNSVALFNQAVACEKLHMYECATHDYERVLKVEKDSGWAAEARERLNRIKEKQTSRATKLHEIQDPAKIRIRTDGGDAISGLQSELYLDPVLQEWLASEKPTIEMKHRSFALAEALERDHDDTWLADFLKAKPSSLANKLLRSAIKENHDGSSRQGGDEAKLARTAFLQVKNIPGAARSEFELLYAFQRQSLSNQCIRELPRFSRLLHGKKYRWLETQELLELSSCDAMSANFDSAWNSAWEAADHARSFNYGSLALRALGWKSTFHTLEGRLPQSWQSNNLGLELFWNGLYPADRGFQFYADLGLAAEQSNQFYLAAVLQREALEMLSGTGRTDMSAITHFRLGVLLGLIGLSRDSEAEINESYRLFRNLPASSSTSLYQAFCEILLANLEAHRGAPPVALDHLRRAKAAVESASNFSLRLRFLNAYAEIARLGGDHEEEERLLEENVSIGRAAYYRLHSEKDRWDWANTAGAAKLRLFELKMQRPHDPVDSLAIWEGYRNYQSTRVSSGAGPPNGRSQDNTAVVGQLNRVPGNRLIVFAVLPTRTIVWVAHEGQVREFSLPIEESMLSQEVRNFYRLCSDRSSPLEDVKKAGFRLYQWLLAPIKDLINQDDVLLIDADGVLGLVPWSALTVENGVYFGQLHTIMNTTGLFARENPRNSMTRPRTLVAYPGPVELEGELFKPLPEAEAEAESVAKLSPGTLYLHGKEANADKILHQLRNFSTFYFSGHAAERAYGGELVVQGPHGGEIISASRLERLNLPRTRLVVLSACYTALAPGNTPGNPNGLVGAFLSAGATEVVASHWGVDSSKTSTLMTSFYRNFLAQSSAGAALRAAQDEIRSRTPDLHPYYWASFQAFRAL